LGVLVWAADLGQRDLGGGGPTCLERDRGRHTRPGAEPARKASSDPSRRHWKCRQGKTYRDRNRDRSDCSPILLDSATAECRSAAAQDRQRRQWRRLTSASVARSHPVQSGVDLPTVKRISGHKTLAMVERYSHQDDDQWTSLRCASGPRRSRPPDTITPELPKGRVRVVTANLKSRMKIGRPCGIRTCDQRIKSPLLYQLS